MVDNSNLDPGLAPLGDQMRVGARWRETQCVADDVGNESFEEYRVGDYARESDGEVDAEAMPFRNRCQGRVHDAGEFGPD
jgi:hypothetical protein